MEIEQTVMAIIGVFIAIVLVGSVVLPSIYSPVVAPLNGSATNTTTYNLNFSQSVPNVTTTSLSTNPPTAARLIVTWATNDINASATQAGSNISFRVLVNGAALGVVRASTTGTQEFFNVTGLVSGNNVITLNTTNVTTTDTINVSSLQLQYYQRSASEVQNWNTAVVTFWSVLLAIVVIAGLILVAAKGFA